jgi:hypothetical protein
MARSKSKNKTLAVGDTAHARITELQKTLGLKNHDETIRHLLDNYCSNPNARCIPITVSTISIADWWLRNIRLRGTEPISEKS